MTTAKMKENSSILVTEANLPTGIIFKNKNHIGNINLWHKFIIRNSEYKNRDTVLRIILDHVHPLDLIPVAYAEDQFGTCSFLARNCAAAIQKICNDNLTIPNPEGGRSLKLSVLLKFANTNEFKVDVQNNITNILNKRYEAINRTLNLSEFHSDPDLTEFCPMSQPKIMYFILHLSKNLTPPPVKYDMSNNRIKLLNPLDALTGHKDLITCIDLSNNLIEDTKTLLPLKLLKLNELCLDNNPLCALYQAEEYTKVIKKYNNHLKILDGVFLRTDGLPTTATNFFCNPDGLDLVNQFLEMYFVQYDSKNRKAINCLYHKNAMFSMNSTFHANQLSSLTAGIWRYKNHSRNLRSSLNSSDMLLKGSIEISNMLSNLPATEHDPFSFHVDLMHYTDVSAVISVFGVFREQPENFLDPERLYGFHRTFVLKLNGHGDCYIINEMLHIYNALTHQVVESFKINKPIDTNMMKTPSTEKEHQQVTDTLRIITRLNLDWAKKCLEECSYDLKRALSLFVSLYKLDKIPEDAFVNS